MATTSTAAGTHNGNSAVTKQLKRPRTSVIEELETALNAGQPASKAVGEISVVLKDLSQDIDALIRCYEILLQLVQKLSSHSGEADVPAPLEVRVNCQTAALDLIEFMTVFGDAMCVVQRPKLEVLRQLVNRTTTCFASLNDKVMLDSRVLLPFTENRYGSGLNSVSATKLVMVSDLNRLKGKIFRAVEMDWEQRQEMIAKLLQNVDEKRRTLMEIGAPPVRGYNDMSDEELRGWSVFHKEVYLAPSESGSQKASSAEK